jgi:HTH-type transcriptional regulator, competence development regulator
MELGSYLQKIRKEKKKTLVQLANDTGLSHSYLSQVENGKKLNPSMESLMRIAKALDLNQNDLLSKSGHLKQLEEEANAVKYQVKFDDYLKEEEENHLKMINSFCKDFIQLYESGNKNVLMAAKKIAERVNQINTLKEASYHFDKATQDVFTGFELIED